MNRHCYPLIVMLAYSFALCPPVVTLARQHADSDPTSEGADRTSETSAVENGKVDDILSRLESADDELKSLEADVVLTVTQLIKENPDDPDDVKKYYGDLKLLRMSPHTTLTWIHFEKWNDGHVWYDNPVWYVFDGHWFTEAKQKTQDVIRREIVRPGEKLDPFKLGEGPFPIPFGQSKDEMQRHFELSIVPPRTSDVPDADHLSCIPKPGTDLAEQYRRIELWVSRNTSDRTFGLPIQLLADNRKQAVLQKVEFSNIRVNPPLSPSDFELPDQTTSWEVYEEPLPVPLNEIPKRNTPHTQG